MTDIKENTSGQDRSRDRQGMIDKIYEVVKPTHFAFISNDDGLSGRDVEYVMIGDVLNWLLEEIPQDIGPDVFYKHRDTILELRDYYNLRQPIEDQSDECIKYVYDLLSEK